MSLDVFGRKLGRTEGSRGPPGIGYKLTNDGQYDIEQKRLCNVAPPNLMSDAANLDTVQRLIRLEIQGVIDLLTGMRSEIDNLNIIVEAHRDELDKALLTLDVRVKEIQETIQPSNE